MDRVDDVQIERFAGGARFFGAIKNGDLADGCGEGFHEMLHRERPIQADLQEAKLLATGVEVFDGFMRRFRAGTHHHQNAIGIGCAEIIKEVIRASDHLGEPIHGALSELGAGIVIRIAALAHLEKHVRILCRASQHRVFRRKSALAVLEDAVHVDEGAHVVFVQHFDLVHFVGGAEAVEEVEEGNSRLERCGVCDEGEVHGFLHGIRAEHGVARGAAEHDVAVIAENGKGMGGHGARRNMKCGWRQLAGDLVHVGDHEQQSLRSRKSRGQRAGLQRAMHRARGSAFALHLHHVRHGAPDVLDTLRGPFVGPLTHRRGWRDGIDGNHFIDAVRHVGYRFIGVHGLELTLHVSPLRLANGTKRKVKIRAGYSLALVAVKHKRGSRWRRQRGSPSPVIAVTMQGPDRKHWGVPQVCADGWGLGVTLQLSVD